MGERHADDAHAVATDPLTICNFGVHFQPNVSVVPDRAETPINLTTAGFQGSDTAKDSDNPIISVSSDAAGNYVIAWESIGAGSVVTDFAVFDADGTPPRES